MCATLMGPCWPRLSASTVGQAIAAVHVPAQRLRVPQGRSQRVPSRVVCVAACGEAGGYARLCSQPAYRAGSGHDDDRSEHARRSGGGEHAGRQARRRTRQNRQGGAGERQESAPWQPLLTLLRVAVASTIDEHVRRSLQLGAESNKGQGVAVEPSYILDIV